MRQNALLTGVLLSALIAPAAVADADCHALPQASVAEPGKQKALGTDIEILSWNIQKAGAEGWSKDFGDLAQPAQLVFLQEATLQAGIPALLPDAWVSVFSEGYTTDAIQSGVMTLAASAPISHCRHSSIEPLLRTPKAASVAHYPLKGRSDTLLAINLHAVNFSLGLTSLRDQFKPLVAALLAHEGPAIVAGDFNTWSESRQVLVDQFMSAQGLAPVQFADDQRSRPTGRALDHVYVRGMTTRSAEVLPVSSSDHNPIRLRVSINDAIAPS